MPPLPLHLDDSREEPDRWKALLFAAAVHLALIGALFLGVQWKNPTPRAVEVEMWRGAPPMAVAEPPPEPAPPRSPEPKPEPRPEPKPEAKPDIVVKKEEKPKKPEPPKPEPKKPEPPKPEPKKEEKPAEKAPPRRPSFDDELRREEHQLQQQNATRELSARAAAESSQRAQAQAASVASARERGLADYTAKIRGKIRGNIVLPPTLQGNPQAIFEVTQLPTGEVLSVKISKSSGNPALDSAIERAILKSSPLPRPDQPELFERTLKIPYKPFED